MINQWGFGAHDTSNQRKGREKSVNEVKWILNYFCVIFYEKRAREYLADYEERQCKAKNNKENLSEHKIETLFI